MFQEGTFQFQKKSTLKKVLMFSEMELSIPKFKKKQFIFSNNIFSCILGGNLQSWNNKHFLYFLGIGSLHS